MLLSGTSLLQHQKSNNVNSLALNLFFKKNVLDFSVLSASGAPRWLMGAVRALYVGQRSRFRVGKGLGPWHIISRGVRQGDPLSALLFVFCLDPILRMTYAKRPPENWVGAFADDVALILRRGDRDDVDWLALIESLLWNAAALCINYDKTRLLPLQPGGHSEFMSLIGDILPHARDVTMTSGSRYLGFWVGDGGTHPAWEAPLDKVLRRSALLSNLRVGAPAALKMAQFIIWSCLGHLFAVFSEPRECTIVFHKVIRMLVRGPQGWIQIDQVWHLNLLGWPVAPPHPDAIGFRRRIGLICRREWWSILIDFELLKEGVFHADGPLLPFLAKWFKQSCHACLAETARVAVLGGLLAEQDDGTIRLRSPLRKALASPSGLGRFVRSWLSGAGRALSDGRRTIKKWLSRRVGATLGPEWQSDYLLERLLVHFAGIRRRMSPKFSNALLRAISGGVVLTNFEGEHEPRCLLNASCGGENASFHYPLSRCWHCDSLARRFPGAFPFPQALKTTRSRDVDHTAAVAFYLVKALNFTILGRWMPLGAPSHQ